MRWDGMQGRYYDFKDGDNFMWQERKLATLSRHKNGECSWWEIHMYNECESNMFLGYDKDLPQSLLDDICQVFYVGITKGLVFTSETERAAFKSIPCSK